MIYLLPLLLGPAQDNNCREFCDKFGNVILPHQAESLCLRLDRDGSYL